MTNKYNDLAERLTKQAMHETEIDDKTTVNIINSLFKVWFPKVFLKKNEVLTEVLADMAEYLKSALMAINKENNLEIAIDDADSIMLELPNIQKKLLKDLQAIVCGDPAVYSPLEIIRCYPGFYAIAIYRFANELVKRNIPILPRMLSEYAHAKTGIDIHPGAQIGECFFIDHGTGIVIGETTIIGKHVKLYQGVTLGALSLEKGHKLKSIKRHPTINDHVTIYAGATILGGDTVIGSNVTIGGNAFITTSIPDNTVVIPKNQEVIFKNKKAPQILYNNCFKED